jgi:hypothetical protein
VIGLSYNFKVSPPARLVVLELSFAKIVMIICFCNKYDILLADLIFFINRFILYRNWASLFYVVLLVTPYIRHDIIYYIYLLEARKGDSPNP